MAKPLGKILFIVNPTSGWHNGATFESVVKRLHEFRGVEYDVVMTEFNGHAKLLAARAVESGSYGVVVAVGGDGTVNEVGSVLAGSDVAMGVIPMGRGNGFARHLGYSMRVRQALRQLLNGEVGYVDMLDINGVASFNVSGIGFDALVAYAAAHTKVRGVFSYIWGAITQFWRYRSYTYKITIDGNTMTLKAFLLSFANTNQYGSNVVIAPRASVVDGVMELCVIDTMHSVLWAGLDYTRYMLLERNAKTHSFRMFHCKEVEIEGRINIVHIDGEPMTMSSPLRVRVLPGHLKVLIPPRELLQWQL